MRVAIAYVATILGLRSRSHDGWRTITITGYDSRRDPTFAQKLMNGHFFINMPIPDLKQRWT